MRGDSPEGSSLSRERLAGGHRYGACVRTWSVAAVAVLAIAAGVILAVTPIHTSSGRVCEGAGGALHWELGGARQQLTQAQDEAATAQRALDSRESVPADQQTPMDREVIDDSHDQLASAREALAVQDQCQATAVTRLELSVLAAVVVAGLLLMALLVVRVVRARWRARPARAEPPEDFGRCPHCDAQLDNPLGCWNCEAFRDGEIWRLPATAPPCHERKLGR